MRGFPGSFWEVFSKHFSFKANSLFSYPIPLRKFLTRYRIFFSQRTFSMMKVIAREAGDRTKIAVFSKDEKVDCLGACVGMRGTRVKNIVRELHGERVDVIRWKEDVKEFITEALQPAKVADIHVDAATQQAVVLVEDDQLSLAIGKRGQNVRLAS